MSLSPAFDSVFARGTAKVMAALASLICSTCAARAATDDPAKTMARISQTLGLQMKMPGATVNPEIELSTTHWHVPGTAAEWVLAIAVGVALLLVLYAMRDNLPFRSRRRRPTSQRPGAVVLGSQAAIERMTEAADDADVLAGDQRFAEAMHVLLLRSLAEMRRRLGLTIADSLTSREVLRQLRLPEAGRRALGELIALVEPVHFGARPAQADDYAACRDAFDALVDTMRPAGAPR